MGAFCCKHAEDDEYKGLLQKRNTPLIQAIADDDEDLLQDPEILAIIGGQNSQSGDDLSDGELEKYIQTINPQSS